jgi:hypothetical protein
MEVLLSRFRRRNFLGGSAMNLPQGAFNLPPGCTLGDIDPPDTCHYCQGHGVRVRYLTRKKRLENFTASASSNSNKPFSVSTANAERRLDGWLRGRLCADDRRRASVERRAGLGPVERGPDASEAEPVRSLKLTCLPGTRIRVWN